MRISTGPGSSIRPYSKNSSQRLSGRSAGEAAPIPLPPSIAESGFDGDSGVRVNVRLGEVCEEGGGSEGTYGAGQPERAGRRKVNVKPWMPFQPAPHLIDHGRRSWLDEDSCDRLSVLILTEDGPVLDIFRTKGTCLHPRNLLLDLFAIY